MTDPKFENIQRLARIAKELEELTEELVFAGGAALCLLITDKAIATVRPTDDVDFMVDVDNRSQYYLLLEKLREKGFVESVQEELICRLKKGEIIIDIMPTNQNILGFSNRWYKKAVEHSLKKTIDNVDIQVIAAPYFVATKIEAFLGRGDGDFMASHDIEDVVAVVDGREELLTEIDKSDATVKKYLAEEIGKLLENEEFLDALPGHLAPDSGSQGRVQLVEERLKKIAAMA